jgi:hypothetical protein
MDYRRNDGHIAHERTHPRPSLAKLQDTHQKRQSGGQTNLTGAPIRGMFAGPRPSVPVWH